MRWNCGGGCNGKTAKKKAATVQQIAARLKAKGNTPKVATQLVGGVNMANYKKEFDQLKK